MNTDPTTKRHRALTPNYQGALDSLCGLYAIVNALRVVAAARGARPSARTLFTEVVEQADREISLAEALTVGIEPDLLWRILQATTMGLEGRRGLSVTIDRLLPHAQPLTVVELHQWIERDIRETGAAFIVALFGRFDHWSVVHGVTPSAFRLFDSDGSARLDLRRCVVMDGAVPNPPGLHRIAPGGIFRVAPRFDDLPPPAEPARRRSRRAPAGNR